MTLEEYKKKTGQDSNKNNYFKNLITRILISMITTLVILILCNVSDVIKDFVKKDLFETDFKFSSITKLYNRYFLSLPHNKEETVNSELIFDYTSKEEYEDGVKLSVGENYPVKLNGSGIVVFIGNKEKYGNTVIVQQSNGIDVWYGNIENVNVKIYDYVEKNLIIGNANKELYLVFQKNGVFQDYKEFIK